METKPHFSVRNGAIVDLAFRAPYPWRRKRPTMEFADSAEVAEENRDARGIMPHPLSSGRIGGVAR